MSAQSDDSHLGRGHAMEVVAEIGQEVAALLQASFGCTEEDAKRQGRAVALNICTRWGGDYIYFPKTPAIDQRQWSIYDEFNGHNVPDLAIKYGVSVQWVYSLIRRCRKFDLTRRQVDMFGGEEAPQVAAPGRPSSGE